MRCRIVPFVPGRRPTDEDARPGLGSSDAAAMVTGAVERHNEAVLLLELEEVPSAAAVRVTVSVDGQPLDGWKDRPLDLRGAGTALRQRIVLRPEVDLAGVDLGFAAGFMRRAEVEVRCEHRGATAVDRAALALCDVRNLGSLYERIIERVVAPDAARQASAASVDDPGPSYHPWFPVLLIGREKAALYTRALVADIVDKEHHLTDPTWLLRVGVYLELLTCLGIVEAVRDDIGDLLEPSEREAFEESNRFREIRDRITPGAWREVWRSRRIAFPGIGTPRMGPVSAQNLLRKRDTTLRFLHAHHEDLKQAIDLAGPNHRNAQETWQRVFRDAERAVLAKAADAFPELAYLPSQARDLILWQRIGFAGQQGVYPTACNQYRASMNMVADWAKDKGLMDHAGTDCVPPTASLLEALMGDRARVAILQRQDGLGPRLDVSEPAAASEPTTEEIEALLAEVPIFRMLSPENVRSLAFGARPLLLGPTQRFVVQGQEGTSLFVVGDGAVEVRLRKEDGTDWLVETIGRGEVVGEMSLLTGEARAATVRSVGETVVFEISRQQYEPLLRSHPEWLDELATVMEDRLARRRGGRSQMETEGRLPLLERIRRNFIG